MLKLRKIISFGISAAMLAATVPVLAEGTVETNAENVLYYNTFDNGKDTVVAAETDDYTLTFNIGGGGWNTATFDGNPGVATNSNAWPSAHTFLFDFTKGGTKAGISSGTYKVSFDFSTSNGGGDNMYFMVNANSDTWDGGRFATITSAQGFSVFNYVTAWGPDDTNKIWPKNDSEKYHCDMILDFSNKIINTYVDGTFLGTTTGLNTMNNFAINMAGQCDYFDNLKLSELYNEIYRFETEAKNVAAGYVDITFPTAMNTAKGTFAVDGETAEAVWTSVSKVRISSKALKTLGEHTITVRDAANIYGVAPATSQLTVNFTICADGDVVLYENDFNNGAEDLTYDEHETYYAGIDKNAVNTFFPATKNNNPGAFFYRKDGNRTVVVNFKNPLTSGKIKVSFDFIMQSVKNDEGENKLETTTIGVNMSQHWTNNVMGEFQTVEVDGNKIGRFYAKTDAAQNCSNLKEKYSKEISLNELHTFDMVLPIVPEWTYGTFYIDGEKITDTSHFWGQSVPNIALNFNDYFAYVDNVKISYLKEGTFEVTGAKAPAAGQDYIDIYTSEMPNSAITADMVTVNGENATAVSVLTNPGAYENNQRYVIRAKLASPVVSGETYAISVADTATNFLGTKINSRNNTAVVETLAQTSLTIENNTVKAVVSNTTEGNMALPVVIAASYDGNGRLINARICGGFMTGGEAVENLAPGKYAELSADISDMSGTVRAFMWKDLNSMEPVIAAAE